MKTLGTACPYTVLRPHARGTLGSVHVARDESLHREVALKELEEPAAADPASLQHFVAEAQLTGRLEHPGIVPVYALGTDAAGRPYYAMKLVQGRTLRAAIDAQHASPTPQGLRELSRRFVMACHTIAYAHAHGIVHRDLKPENILLGEFGETLVLHWAQAGVVTANDTSAATGGDLVPRSSATDIHSLGELLQRILTAVRPSHRPRGTASPLESICRQALARAPEECYATASALAADVQAWDATRCRLGRTATARST